MGVLQSPLLRQSRHLRDVQSVRAEVVVEQVEPAFLRMRVNNPLVLPHQNSDILTTSRIRKRQEMRNPACYGGVCVCK